MLKVYYGNSDYAKYDHSVCQWNQFQRISVQTKIVTLLVTTKSSFYFLKVELSNEKFIQKIFRLNMLDKIKEYMVEMLVSTNSS